MLCHNFLVLLLVLDRSLSRSRPDKTYYAKKQLKVQENKCSKTNKINTEQRLDSIYKYVG